jgi:hypothetical protein
LGGISGSLQGDRSFLNPGDGLRRDDVNGDTKVNAGLSGTTSTPMLARPTIEGSVKTKEDLMILPRATAQVVAQDGAVVRVDVIAGRWVTTRQTPTLIVTQRIFSTDDSVRQTNIYVPPPEQSTTRTASDLHRP